jgi:hypothetical protein
MQKASVGMPDRNLDFRRRDKNKVDTQQPDISA